MKRTRTFFQRRKSFVVNESLKQATKDQKRRKSVNNVVKLKGEKQNHSIQIEKEKTEKKEKREKKDKKEKEDLIKKHEEELNKIRAHFEAKEKAQIAEMMQVYQQHQTEIDNFDIKFQNKEIECQQLKETYEKQMIEQKEMDQLKIELGLSLKQYDKRVRKLEKTTKRIKKEYDFEMWRLAERRKKDKEVKTISDQQQLQHQKHVPQNLNNQFQSNNAKKAPLRALIKQQKQEQKKENVILIDQINNLSKTLEKFQHQKSTIEMHKDAYCKKLKLFLTEEHWKFYDLLSK